MKKVVFAVMAMMTIGFASCGNKTQASAEADDSAAVINVEDEAAATINALTEQMEAKDATKFQEVLATVQEKIKSLIASNPDAAQTFVAQVQAFLKENAEKIKEFVGDNEAVTAAVASLTETSPESIVKSITELGESAQSKADLAVENVKDAANQAVEDTKAAANKAVEDTKAAANKAVEDSKNAAKEKAGKSIDDAASKAKSALGL